MLKARWIPVALLGALIASTSIQTSVSAAPKVGQICKKKGVTKTFNSVVYLCASSKGKLRWKVSSYSATKPSALGPTPTPSPTSTPGKEGTAPLPGINLSIRSISSSHYLSVRVGETLKDSIRVSSDVNLESIHGRLIDKNGEVKVLARSVLERAANRDSDWSLTYELAKELPSGIYKKIVDAKTIDGRIISFYEAQLEVMPASIPGLLLRTSGTCVESENNCPKITDAIELPKIEVCKIYDDWEIQSFSQGFPRPRLAKVGDRDINVLWMPVSFTDLPFGNDFVEKSEKAFAEMRKFFLAQSYGKSRITFTIPDSKLWLSQNKPWNAFNAENSSDLTQMMQTLLNQVTAPNLSNFDAIFLITSESKVIQSGGMTKPTYETARFGPVNGVYLVVGGDYEGVSHSIGHNLYALEDLYIHPFYERPNINKWPMQFEIMGGGGIYSGWQRWINGWIDDKDVRCSVTSNLETIHALNSLSSKSGPRLLVIPLGPRKVWIAEVRNEDGNEGNGLFIYSLDTNISHGAGPMTSINQTFGVGQSWSNSEIKITVLAQSQERLFVSVKKN
jgi:hypothetical protein